jgi:uncharacterized protein (DUF433 family)
MIGLLSDPMTTATTVEISTLLYTLPSPSDGRLCLFGSGVSVRRVSILYNEGLSPEEIQAEYPHLSTPAIYAAIAHYPREQSEAGRGA